jgi:uncharacterized protein
MRTRLPALAGLLVLSAAAWAQSPPPAPDRYFTDHAGLVGAGDAQRLEQKLERFDRETTNQVLVVVYPKIPSDSLEDFTARAAQAWRVGRDKLDNGVVLFVFVQDRKARLEVGYGLEGALPDLRARRIIDEQLGPAFAAGRYAEGLDAAVEAVFAASRGEYRREPARHGGGGAILILLAFFIPAIFLLAYRLRHLPAATYDGTGYDASPWTLGSHHGHRRRRDQWWGGGWGGGGGGGSWGGGGGGFSGGGGSFGGGGATGSW